MTELFDHIATEARRRRRTRASLAVAVTLIAATTGATLVAAHRRPDTVSVADPPRRIRRTVGEPFELEGHRVVVGSVGVATSDIACGSPADMLREAGAAARASACLKPICWPWFSARTSTRRAPRRWP